jgi:two-component system sensor histidine kinase KdpD
VNASAHADRVELRVVDSGPGIPRDAADTVFAPFQRLGDRHTATGLGLGLSVARGFTSAMGGTLTIEDTPGGGCTVVIALPAAPAENPTFGGDANRDVSLAPHTPGPTRSGTTAERSP